MALSKRIPFGFVHVLVRNYSRGIEYEVPLCVARYLAGLALLVQVLKAKSEFPRIHRLSTVEASVKVGGWVKLKDN